MVPKIATGKPITIQILKMLLPMISPTMRSVSLRRAATIVVTSSGKEVPSAMTVSEMIRSDTPMAEAINSALFTTSWLPATRLASPIMVIRKDLPSLYLGFSAFLDLTSRFFLAMMMR